MNILVFSHFFPPEIGAAPMRISDHACRWVRAGHSVTVITNIPNSPFGKFYTGYKNRLYYEENYRGIKVKRILTFPSGKKKSKFHRAFSFAVNTIGSILAGIIQKKPDIIIASAPYLSGIPGMLSSVWYNVPLVYELRDPWVQVAAKTKTVKKRSLQHKFLEVLERKIVDHAQELVVIGEEMASFLQKEMVLPKKPFVVHNAIDIENNTTDIKQKIHLPAAEGCFVIGTIGNMGNQYDFDVILEAASKLSGHKYYFLFLGEGKQRRDIKQKAEKLKLENVGFFQPVPSFEVDNWFKACDMTIVSMKRDSVFKVYLPLKTLGSMNAEIPVLFGGSGETENILRESGAGRCFPSGDTESLVELLKYYNQNRTVLQTQGNMGRRFIESKFNRTIMADKYLNLFKTIITRKKILN